jgi:hypothetical protein
MGKYNNPLRGSNIGKALELKHQTQRLFRRGSGRSPVVVLLYRKRKRPMTDIPLGVGNAAAQRRYIEAHNAFLKEYSVL